MIDERRLYQLVGERIRKVRERGGVNGTITQADLAELVGLERTSITNIEKGNQKMPLHVLFKLCDVLQLKITDVLPSVTEVQMTSARLAETEVAIAGSNFRAPPLVAQAVAALLTGTGTNNASLKK
jgi:DNA-binding XRE family transcriptional regulator